MSQNDQIVVHHGHLDPYWSYRGQNYRTKYDNYCTSCNTGLECYTSSAAGLTSCSKPACRDLEKHGNVDVCQLFFLAAWIETNWKTYDRDGGSWLVHAALLRCEDPYHTQEKCSWASAAANKIIYDLLSSNAVSGQISLVRIGDWVKAGWD